MSPQQMRFHRPVEGARGSKQGGSALIMGLIMLIVVTMMGLTAMQSTTQQERMSGHKCANARRLAIVNEARIARQSQREGRRPAFGVGEIELAKLACGALATRVNDDEAGSDSNLDNARTAL